MWSNGGGWHMGWAWLWMIGGILLIAVAVNVFSRAGRNSASTSVDAIELLRRQYASGEIDHDTFVRMRDELRG